MKGIIGVAAAISIALMRFASGAYTSEMGLCADMCPSSTLVAADGAGISRCYEACKRLIHRVKYGDILDDMKIDKVVSAPKESALTRLRKGLGKKKPGSARPTSGSSSSSDGEASA
ncbi:cyclosome subunit, putative [Babesia ovata]|uniref:Cyclosome subunit, putative n=1 Tax=Babesia ovata TaxID=189622 RepID=A0A2H6K9Y8_9APIC|nr:cyclosome subunit, putative [Babesia ovata]GBE59811.1 cyclosome subunit, putative [Babesia ovata]